jgi:hypothetical protein
MTNNLREILETTMKHFRMADPKIARRQGAKLIRAKSYLAERGIAAADPNSTLVYTKAIGMFNPTGGNRT